jgi:superfamily II DNA helicase RecQ
VKFKFLIRMQANNTSESGDRNIVKQHQEQKISHLEDMENYCVQLKCRRNTLIAHFGGKTVDCKKTCDYCNKPHEVEKALRSAKAAKDVRKQKWGGFQKQSWNGQWDGPHDEVFPDESNDGMMVGDLRVTGPLEIDPGVPDVRSGYAQSGPGFMKASDILSKYEAMERKVMLNGRIGGSSDQASNGTNSSLNMPEHLIAALNAASTNATMKQRNEKKSCKSLSSQDYEKKANDIEKKLAELKSERETRMKALLEKKGDKKSAPPPPPPPLSFGRKKH